LIDQTRQRHLGGVPPEAEHRFAKKHLAELYAVQTARQLSGLVGFDGVAEPELMKLLIGSDHVVVEPGVGPSAPRGRAAADGGAEGMIDPRDVWTIAQRLAQT